MEFKWAIATLQLITLVASAAVKARPAQVHEDVDETPLVSPTATLGRTVRQPTTNPARVQRFDVFAMAQLDQQRWRYLQQQQADARNRARIKRRGRDSKREIHQVPIYLLPEPIVNFGLDHAENVRLLQESFGDGRPQERDIEALHALLGKAPGVQLEGLQQLLAKDHTPITENVVDVENPQVRPNIRVEPAPLEHQEAVAQAHVHADAQKKVKQQYRALAEIQRELDAMAQRARAQQINKAQQETAQSQNQAQAYYGLDYRSQLEQPQKVEDGKIYDGTKDLQYASKYAFGYRVRDYHSGNNFGHEEVSDGKTAKGNYHVLLPDGRLQNVQYWADETGFHAKVTYDRVAQHPVCYVSDPSALKNRKRKGRKY